MNTELIDFTFVNSTDQTIGLSIEPLGDFCYIPSKHELKIETNDPNLVLNMTSDGFIFRQNNLFGYKLSIRSLDTNKWNDLLDLTDL